MILNLIKETLSKSLRIIEVVSGFHIKISLKQSILTPHQGINVWYYFLRRIKDIAHICGCKIIQGIDSYES